MNLRSLSFTLLLLVLGPLSQAKFFVNGEEVEIPDNFCLTLESHDWAEGQDPEYMPKEFEPDYFRLFCRSDGSDPLYRVKTGEPENTAYLAKYYNDRGRTIDTKDNSPEKKCQDPGNDFEKIVESELRLLNLIE